MNKQNIYENVRYYIGKITVILMMVLFPFVMTDKLNNVTKTRYVFFVIISLVGWIAMLINEVVFRIIISGDYPGAKKSLDIKKNFNIKIIYNIKNRKHIIYSVLLIASSIISYLVSPYKNIADEHFCAHYTICPALLFHASEVSKKLLSDYEVVILYHIFVQLFSTYKVP